MLICIGQITPGAGKVALAGAPSWPLPKEIVARVKPGFKRADRREGGGYIGGGQPFTRSGEIETNPLPAMVAIRLQGRRSGR
jgi:hypothetical protein